MKFTVVKEHNGRPAIHWPGILLMAIATTVAFSLGVAAFSFAVGWFSPYSFVMLPAVLGSIIGINIKHGMQQVPPRSN